jgi:1D-myo-inositol 3-kinase
MGPRCEKDPVSILVAGHYCHDTILSNEGTRRALGGSAAYASAILRALGEPYEVAAKAGADFLYAAEVEKQPRIVEGRTSAFVDDYRSGERRDFVEAVCEPIWPEDLHGRYDVGIACAITGEVPLLTLARMREICGVMVADAQGLLREIAPDGRVTLRPLDARTPALIDVLKASVSEAALLDVAALRRELTLIVTDGPRGCIIHTRDAETRVPALPAIERDPTGAGDCFLAGLAAGLARGFDPLRAARIGAYCGARAVEHHGVPRLTPAEARAALAS